MEKSFVYMYDIVIIIESHCNANVLAQLTGYKCIGDPKFPMVTAHGGIAAYLKDELFDYVMDIRFTKVCIAFALSCFPGYCFIAVYMYPVDSLNYSLEDVGNLSEEISYWRLSLVILMHVSET